MNFKELNNNELQMIDGGEPVSLTLLGAAFTIVAGVNACYDMGKNIGGYIYYITH